MIEAVSHNNLDELLPLIRQYQEFYRVEDISDHKNKEFFSQFGEASSSGCQFAFRLRDRLVGFATVYFSFSSSATAKVGVLNDLFTLPDCRGQGVGRKLIEHSYRFALSKGAVRLQWLTAQDNGQAQALYDSLGAKKSPWFFYAYST